MRICQYCGKEVVTKRGPSACPQCKILNYCIRKRVRAKKPKHTSEELEAIKKKYANGVPAGEIEQWIRGL